MAIQLGDASSLAAGAAAFVLPPSAFPTAAPGRVAAEAWPRGDHRSSGRAAAAAAAVGVGLVAVGRAGRRRRTALPRRAVLTTDEQGRDRFAVAAGTSAAGAASAAPSPPQATGATPRAGCSEPFDATTSAVGITAPLGFWDPLGLSRERDGKGGYRWKSENDFYLLQEAEIKHGRVAMLAALGLLASSFSRFPGFGEVPDGFGALFTKAGAGLGIILIAAGILELESDRDLSREPGNLGDPAGLLANSDGEYLAYSVEMRNKEINHGRLAMSGVITSLLLEYETTMGSREQLEYVFSHGGVAVLGFLLIALQQTPEFTDEEVQKIKDNMAGKTSKELAIQ